MKLRPNGGLIYAIISTFVHNCGKTLNATKTLKKKTGSISETRILKQINQIEYHTDNHDMPSVLKEFKIFARKPYIPVAELDGKEGTTIVNPDEIRTEIDKNIENILRGKYR